MSSAHASASSAERSIRSMPATSRPRRRRARRARARRVSAPALARAAASPVSSRSPRRSTASRWRRSRSTASTGLDASDDELRRRGPSYTADTLDRFARARPRRRRRFSSSPAPTRSQKLRRGSAIPRCSTSRTSWSSRGRVTSADTLADAPAGARGRGCTTAAAAPPGLGRAGHRDLLLVTAADARRVVDGHPAAAAAGESDLRDWCPTLVERHILQHGLYSTIVRFIRLRQITCMAKTENGVHRRSEDG